MVYIADDGLAQRARACWSSERASAVDAARHLSREPTIPSASARVPGTAVFMTGDVRHRADGAAAQPQAQQGAARAHRADERADRGHPARAGGAAARDPPSRSQFPHHQAALRLRRRAQHPARPGAVPGPAIPLQPDGDVVLPAAREDRGGAALAVRPLAQAALHPDVEHDARMPPSSSASRPTASIELGGQIEI